MMAIQSCNYSRRFSLFKTCHRRVRWGLLAFGMTGLLVAHSVAQHAIPVAAGSLAQAGPEAGSGYPVWSEYCTGGNLCLAGSDTCQQPGCSCSSSGGGGQSAPQTATGLFKEVLFGNQLLDLGRSHAGRGSFANHWGVPPAASGIFAAGRRGQGILAHRGVLGPHAMDVPTALFGWADPSCVGCNPGGYPPHATPYPSLLGGGGPATPGGVWAGIGSDGSYLNLGNDCCGPHWYDFMIQSVYMSRAQDSELILSSFGIRGNAPPTVALSSDDIDFDFEPAYRVAGRFQLSAVKNVEAIYLGGLTWSENAFAVSNNNSLYSIFSDFGNTPFGGFEETDQASRHDYRFDSELDSVEINLRKSWVSPNSSTNGSWLIGVRYLKIDEELRYNTQVSAHFDPINMVPRGPASAQYDVFTRNDLVGVHVGSELVHCLSRGIQLSAEGKFGIFGNDVDQGSSLVSNTLPNGVTQANDGESQFAYALEGNLFFLWQFHPLFKFRSGYEVLFVDGIALAQDNFNAQVLSQVSTFGFIPQTPLFDNGEAFYHGFHLGLEFGW